MARATQANKLVLSSRTVCLASAGGVVAVDFEVLRQRDHLCVRWGGGCRAANVALNGVCGMAGE